MVFTYYKLYLNIIKSYVFYQFRKNMLVHLKTILNLGRILTFTYIFLFHFIKLRGIVTLLDYSLAPKRRPCDNITEVVKG